MSLSEKHQTKYVPIDKDRLFLPDNRPVTVLLDHSIMAHSDFTEGATQKREIQWGPHKHIIEVHGVRKKTPNGVAKYQAQIDALPTIGRLIRNNEIGAYTYEELLVEKMRGCSPSPTLNAFEGCKIDHCPSPVCRTKFRSTINLNEHIAKGGKKDPPDIAESKFTQLAFLQWLVGLDDVSIDYIANNPTNGIYERFTDFERSSLNDLKRFRFLCQRAQSRENYVDMFHLWTAERNQLDVFLTLEARMPNIARQVENRKGSWKTHVLRPLDFLRGLGIEQLDEFPLVPEQFYHLHEVPSYGY